MIGSLGSWVGLGPDRNAHMSPVAVFVATAYGLSIALSRVVGLTGRNDSSIIGLRYVSMFLPAVAVLVVSSTMNEKPRMEADRLPLSYLAVALFLIPFVLPAVTLPTLALLDGKLPWQDWLTPQADGLFHTPASRDVTTDTIER